MRSLHLVLLLGWAVGSSVSFVGRRPQVLRKLGSTVPLASMSSRRDDPAVADGSEPTNLDKSQLESWATILHPKPDRVARLDEHENGSDEFEFLKSELFDVDEGQWRCSTGNCTALAELEGYWAVLAPSLRHLHNTELQHVKFALEIAYYAHNGQKRKSGEPFIIHPVSVAELLAGLRMDVDTLAAGLLHDTVEDTDLDFQQLELMFGPEVRKIVEGETKVSKLPKIALTAPVPGAAPVEQAENLRQMFIAMSEDFRIIIVKLADRLHNMRTLEHMAPHKQAKISRETLEIFAPLAHRLGFWQFKSELEDLSFRYLYPDKYHKLKDQLGELRSMFSRALESSRLALNTTLEDDLMLKEQSVTARVTGRLKETYSLWVKMQKKSCAEPVQLNDVVALRVVLDIPQRPEESLEEWKMRGVWLCYHVLGLVQRLPDCEQVPTQVKDYISFPKPNGYQSLHTCIMCDQQIVEVQIRTNWMHAVAEYGMAAHWLYKDEKYGNKAHFQRYQMHWMSTIKVWQNEIHNSTEFVDTIRRELLGKRVFVFLRDGKIVNLPRGATVIDAAFAIHSDLGLRMANASINGKPMSLTYELVNGDVVSIATDDDARPALDWIRSAKCRSTRAKLRGYFRAAQRFAMLQKGWFSVCWFLEEFQPLLVQHIGFVPSPAFLMDQLNGAQNGLSGEDFCVSLGRINSRDEVRAVLAHTFGLRFEEVEAYVLASRFGDFELFPDPDAAGEAPNAVAEPAEEQQPEDEADAEAEVTVAASIDEEGEDAESEEDEEDGAPSLAPSFDNAVHEALMGMNEHPGRSSDLSFDPHDHDDGSTDAPLEPRPDLLSAKPGGFCRKCKPVFGEPICGSLHAGGLVLAHRESCPIVSGALHSDGSRQNRRRRGSRDGDSSNELLEKVMGEQPWQPHSDAPVDAPSTIVLAAQWDDRLKKTLTKRGTDVELQVLCKDRKFLLRDVSSVVASVSEIISTNSKTVGSAAILVFEVQISDVDHLTTLTQAVEQIPGVTSLRRLLSRA